MGGSDGKKPHIKSWDSSPPKVSVLSPKEMATDWAAANQITLVPNYMVTDDQIAKLKLMPKASTAGQIAAGYANENGLVLVPQELVTEAQLLKLNMWEPTPPLAKKVESQPYGMSLAKAKAILMMDPKTQDMFSAGEIMHAKNLVTEAQYEMQEFAEALNVALDRSRVICDLIAKGHIGEISVGQTWDLDVALKKVGV